MIYRIFVEKKDNVQAKKEAADIKTLLNIDTEDFRLILRYDVEGLSEASFRGARHGLFEPPVDNVYWKPWKFPKAIKYLVSRKQYDQRADSAAQCVQPTKSRPSSNARRCTR
ncbi:MAG: hypothetical protein ACLRSW_16485 [Christensenellaceae bacterium]